MALVGSGFINSERAYPIAMTFARQNPSDPYNLQRFVEAQVRCYERVLKELGDGHKKSHWMWFIFPQIRGLGRTDMANRYAISSLEEAEAYLRHLILGPRLRHCTGLVLQVEGRSIESILGKPDDLKFRSSMTLFAGTSLDNKIFKDALQKYFDGEQDQLTIDLLK
jgi:uncharacterized protein (DUF1810 family)